MRMVDLIARKRDGKVLSAAEIAFIVREYTAERLPSYQLSALLMAIVFNGMSEDETIALTRAMLESGAVLDLSDLGKPVIDKHSTGGVGDKTSLVVAPVAAAAGLAVPMLSGHSLGHSGGTLDKLESIPGFRTNLTLEEFRSQLARLGVAMISQTDEIAPADRAFYALRDATATVPSIPLITSSILSKKLAEGLDGLVLDVKVGAGAFMKTTADALQLARLLCKVGNEHGTRTQALVTDMNQPIGRAVGNGVEVAECIDVLKGGGPSDLVELCVELSARMIVLGAAIEGNPVTMDDGRSKANDLIGSGEALSMFQRIVEAQGGDPRVVDDPALLARAHVEEIASAGRTGYVSHIDTEELGWILMRLGAGRSGLAAGVDLGVGLLVEAKLGSPVEPGDPLCRVIGRDRPSLDTAVADCLRVFTISDEPPAARATILDVVE